MDHSDWKVPNLAVELVTQIMALDSWDSRVPVLVFLSERQDREFFFGFESVKAARGTTKRERMSGGC